MSVDLHYKAIIENVVKKKCTDLEVSYMISVFRKVVRAMNDNNEDNSFHQLKDFEGTKEVGIENFDLTVHKKEMIGGEHFVGQFINGDKNLKLIASIKESL